MAKTQLVQEHTCSRKPACNLDAALLSGITDNKEGTAYSQWSAGFAPSQRLELAEKLDSIHICEAPCFASPSVVMLMLTLLLFLPCPIRGPKRAGKSVAPNFLL